MCLFFIIMFPYIYVYAKVMKAQHGLKVEIPFR
jgi:hypothetical protein